MAKVVFSPEARKDLEGIGNYIAFTLRNKSAARSLIGRIRDAALSLSSFPESGTPLNYAVLNFVYRYVICGNYMLFYHISENTVKIDRILYGRRDYLSILFGNSFSDEE